MVEDVEIDKPKTLKTQRSWKVETETPLWFRSQMQTMMAEHPSIHPEWKPALALICWIHNKEPGVEREGTEIVRSRERNVDKVICILERVARYMQQLDQGRSLNF